MALGLEICLGFVFLVVIGIILFYIISVFNGLISLRNNIDKAWANIDVLLKQRSDLIPNLIETVKGYKQYEKEVLTHITQLRSSMITGSMSDKATASNQISTALKSIFAVSENYPQLKANENFMELQKELTAIENEIADRREFYNDSVLLYNTRIQSLPDVIIANLLGMKQKEYFKATEQEEKPVNVKF